MVKEHPEDPKSYVREEEWQRAKARGGVPPSVWDWPEVTALEELLGLTWRTGTYRFDGIAGPALGGLRGRSHRRKAPPGMVHVGDRCDGPV